MKKSILQGLFFLLTFHLSSQDFSEYFGTLADGTTITTSNTNFSYVRVGSGGGSIEAESPNCFGNGEGSAMLLGGSSSTSLNGVGVLDDTFTANSFSVMTFKVRSDNMTAGDLVITVGDGDKFSSNQTFTSSQLMWGIQLDAGNVEYRNSSSWVSLGQSLSNSVDYFFEIIANRTGSTVNYTANGGGSVATGTMDFYINESLAGNDISITNNQDARAFRIYQVNGSAIFCIDDIKVWLNTADVNSALPVELLDFRATAMNDEIRLDWQTASEENHRAFILERKSTNSGFEEVGTIAGKGSPASGASYQFTDQYPPPGINYYRLGHEDTNGSITYSAIVEAELSKEGVLLNLKSNPFSTFLELGIELNDEEFGHLVITNLNGQQLFKKEIINPIQDFNLNTQDWEKGLYFLSFISSNEIITEKIFKN